MISKLLPAALLLFLLSGCGPKKEELILGTWKIDSVYTYYNGFGKMENSTEGLEQYVYEPEGQMNVLWKGEKRSWQYKLAGNDTLVYFDDRTELSRFVILKISKDKLTLKKEKLPLFSGKGQERYEIRFFSKQL